MTTPTPPPVDGTAQVGRRLPPGLVPAGPVAATVAAGPDGEIDPTQPGLAAAGDRPLLFPGDSVSCSLTLAVDLDTGGVSYARMATHTFVQEGESDYEAYGRAVEFVRDGVLAQVDDIEEHLIERRAKQGVAQ